MDVPELKLPERLPVLRLPRHNTLTATVSGGSLYVDPPQMTLSYIVPVRVAPYTGNNQLGAIGSPLELMLVARLSGPTGFNIAGQTIHFAVATEPPRTTGTAVGSDEQTTTRTYDATTDSNGYARATAVLGNNEGTYTFTAGMTGAQYGATFTATAKKPSSVAILKDTTDLAKRSATYAVSLTQPTRFTAIGLDKGGAKIGPLKTTWSVTSAQPRGAVFAGPAATTTFTPSAPGDATLTADPPTSGIPTATASIFVTQLYLLLGTPNPADPYHDDLLSYVPGTTSAGLSVLPGAMPQQVTVHLATPPNTTGTVTLQLVDTTQYPGIAMNYPIPAGPLDYDMYFAPSGAPQQATYPNFNPSGDTTAVLYVSDYAAWAHLDCSVATGGKNYTLDQITIPVDGNNNKIADSGWQYSPTGHASDTWPPTDDSDYDPNGSFYPSLGRTGDGLTVLEEYRGFSVGGQHQRLNPVKKDLFILADAELIAPPINGPIAWSTLPHILHYITVDEALLQKSTTSPIQNNIKPVINPNRGGIISASEQRGVRARIQTDYPIVQAASGPTPVWTMAAGYAWLDSEDLRTITRTTSANDETPNNTAVIEYYPRAFENWNISYGQNGIVDGTVDQEGTPMIRCAPGQVLGCVEYDDTTQVLSKPTGEEELLATIANDDYYTKYSYTDCSRTATRLLTTTELDYLRTVAIGHELGHSLGLRHVDSVCGEIMFTQNIGTDDAPIWFTVLDVLPPTVTFDGAEIARTRVHQKH
jgi:hypothetical protein